ncbi:hypothetical protein C2W62_14990 [Candidatus Entotheonella serta]|nr:hypothetical protein C2W62_14990 [Candidatus Entotheonella serta]
MRLNVQIRLFYPYFLALIVLLPLVWYGVRFAPRRLSPVRQRLLIALRVIVLLLVIGGLVRLSLTQAYQRANVLFLLDMSLSVTAAMRQRALDFIQAVVQEKRPEDGIGLVVFGADATLEQSVSKDFTLQEIASEVEGSATHMARAIQAGMASFPPDGARRLALLSDGNENVGSAAEAALIARSLGAAIYPLPLGQDSGGQEVRVEKLVVPRQVQAGAPYQVEAMVVSTVETTASLELFRGGAFAGRQEVTLTPGKNRVRFLQQTSDEGVHLYEVVVNSPQDTLLENNRFRGFTDVLGPPKMLMLHDEPGPSTPLLEALREQGLAVEARPWSSLPHALSGYLEYDALIFDNVPGFGISVSQMEVLEQYVRDMGGGLLMLGGEKSFGAGGYYRTPIEKLLPVDMDIPTKMSIPSLSLVMVIDKSDSMGGSINNTSSPRNLDEWTTKLEVAKIAAFSAIKLLNPFDQAGLLAFNADWEWPVPMSEAGKREQIAGRLSALTHGGGTDLYKGMQEGLRVLKDVKAVKKHLIALSDGLTAHMDFEALMQEAIDNNITVTTVALGKDADRTLMGAIAHWGQGRSYYTDDPLFIPRIFTAETILVSRGLIEESPFQPALQAEHELLQGVDMAQAPPLHGYVVTYGKPAAQLLLVTPKEDPLLAVQRYGLGRTAAFTADLGLRWGKDWARWEGFSQFTAQLMRWIQRKNTIETFAVRADVQDGKGLIQADVYDVADQFVNQLGLEGKVLTPSKKAIPVDFKQTEPGRYAGHFDMQGQGEYLLTLVGEHEGATIGPKTVGVAVPYSPEYLGLDTNYGLLNRLAERTGGRVLRPDVPKEEAATLFATSGQSLTALKEYWPWFAILALCLFVGEIALRQVFIAATRTGRRQRAATDQEPEYTYDELAAIVHRRAEEHRRRNVGTPSRV